MINYILSKSNIMINYVGFTIVWFSCVYSGAKGDPIIALIPTFIFLFLHFLIVTDHLKEEIQLIFILCTKFSSLMDHLYVGGIYCSN